MIMGDKKKMAMLILKGKSSHEGEEKPEKEESVEEETEEEEDEEESDMDQDLAVRELSRTLMEAVREENIDSVAKSIKRLIKILK